MDTATLRSLPELEAGLETIRRSPKDAGELTLIVRRPAANLREVLDEAQLDPAVGLVGDSWHRRASSRTPDGTAHADMQLTIINTPVMALSRPR